MRIGVNARLLLPGRKEGIARFATSVLKRITQEHSEHQYYFYFDRPYSEEYIYNASITPRVLGPQARHPILWNWWFNRSLKRQLKADKCDVFFSPEGYCSLTSDVPQVIVVHDLAFEHFDNHIKSSHQRYLRKNSPLFCKKAKVILTVSEFVAEDIENKYAIEPGKIKIANNATELSPPENVSITVTKNHPYFVYVGALHPRKNILRILEAYATFKQQDDQDTHLVIIGRFAWESKAIQKALASSPYKDQIVHLDKYLGDISPILSGAKALIYPSLFEGFGIPILEGFACQIPVITSNVSSMPEVAGDAALLVDPHSTDAIANAMRLISKDEALRQELIKKGSQRIQNYSWDRAADIVWQSIITAVE